MVFLNQAVFSQTRDIVIHYPPFMDIHGDIVLIGIGHASDTSHGTITALIDSTSSDMFCQLYDTLFKNAGKKEIIFLLEGFTLNTIFKVTEYSKKKYHFPPCIPLGSFIKGCDSRLDDPAIMLQTRVLMALMKKVVTLDTLSGNEKSIQDFFSTKSTVSLGEFESTDLHYFFDTYPVIGQSNREFENTILTEAYALRQKGCFVVVFCGGSHLVKILSEHVLDNVGYAFLIQKNQLGPMIKTAKLLESIEEYK